jgi:predicted porin
MQKKFIALAVAGLVSGVAFAQSNVTIYGVADVGGYYWKGNDNTTRGLASGGGGAEVGGLATSRLGFKGEEALGNGLKALFNYETAVKLDNGGNSPGGKSLFGNTRQAWVGLRSDKLGLVKMGTQSDLTEDWIGGNQEYGYNMSAISFLDKQTGRVSSNKVPGIAYHSPDMAGFTVGAGWYAPNEATGATRSEYMMVGGKYANGPIGAALTYAKINDNAWADNSPYDIDASFSYDFKVVKLFTGYNYSNNTVCDPAQQALIPAVGITPATGCTPKAIADRDQSNSAWTIGAQVPIGANGIAFGGYGAKKNDLSDSNTDVYTLGYIHSLSKRTRLYASYVHIGNDDKALAAPANFNAANPAGANGASYNGFGAGVSHAF